MQSFNHIAGGLTFTGLFASFSDINIFEKPEFIAITVIASILPDIDHTRSLIGKAAYPLAKWLSIKYGHRTITHSFVFLISIILIVKLVDLLFHIGHQYPTIIGYAILSHNVFDMVTKQGVAFWYPFSTRPCVLPGNPNMRLRTNDLRSEAVVFVIFCSLMLFCQPLFANGFWQQYNKTFLTFSHLERETRRRTDYLNVTFLNAQKDTVGGMLVTDIGNEFVILNNKTFSRYSKDDSHFLSFKHSGIIRKPKTIQVMNVSIDSLKKHLNKPILKLQIQSNTDLIYFDGVAQKTTKTIEKEFVTDFEFFTMATDNTKELIEIETLRIRIEEEQSRFSQELNLIQSEINDLESEYSSGEYRYPKMSDYEKGLWVKDRKTIENSIARLNHEKNRKLLPSIKADLIRLQSLEANLKQNKILVSGSFMIL